MPVGVDEAGVIQGRGVLTTRLRKLEATAVVPVLVLDDNVEPALFGRPLRAVAENERLVGLIGVDEAEVQGFFPGETIVPIQLEMSQPLPGPPIAWEALNAIACDGPIPGAELRTFQSLLGSGTLFAIRNPTPPDRDLPWSRHGEWWVLRHDPIGPMGVVDAAAYAPVLSWFPSVAARTRALAVSLGVIFTIAALGASLLRSQRGKLLALGAVTVVALAGLAAWGHRQSPINAVGGNLAVLSGALVQYDVWDYRTTLGGGETAFNWTGNTRPMLMSSEQAAGQQVVLECGGDGVPTQITARLGARHKLACLSRTVEPNSPNLQPRARPDLSESPMHVLVRRAYLAPGIKTLGQFPSTDKQSWPSIILKREIDRVTP